MSEPTFDTRWPQVLNLFQLADEMKDQDLIDKIQSLDLPNTLIDGIIASIKGDASFINEYLSNLSPTYSDLIAWLAPVKINNQKRYAWVIGKISSALVDVRSRFEQASVKVCDDPILMCKQEPKPLMFIETIAVSRFKESNLSQNVDNYYNPDDFAIFQVGYKNPTKKIEHFDQRLVLNSTLLKNNFQNSLRIASNFIVELREIDFNFINTEAELLAILHAEGHNRGHFAGAWPFNNDKHCLLHQAVEEFRACLNAIKWSEYLGLNDYEMNILALGIFTVRFFHFGYRAYINPVKNRQTIREISVGLMFFEVLKQANILQINTDSIFQSHLQLDKVKETLINALEILNQQDFEAKQEGLKRLREIGIYWYKIAYPYANFSVEAQRIYSQIHENNYSK